MRNYAGLDWSGQVGDPRKTPGYSSLLVIALAFVRGQSLPVLEAALADAKRKLHYGSDHVFRYKDAGPQERAEFFAALVGIPWNCRALIINRWDWNADYLRRSSGPDRIDDGVIRLVRACPDDWIERQVLRIDLPPSESAGTLRLRTKIRQALAADGRRSFYAVKPCPDHRPDGGIVQVADMCAGAIRESGGVCGPHLASLKSHIELIEE